MYTSAFSFITELDLSKGKEVDSVKAYFTLFLTVSLSKSPEIYHKMQIMLHIILILMPKTVICMLLKS